MAEDEDYWFVPHRYGLGATPVSWQGWLLIGAYIGAVIATRHLAVPRARLPIIAALTVPMLTLAAARTRGGWRWRWGEKEE